MMKFINKKKPEEETSTTIAEPSKGLTLSGKEKAFIGFTVLHAVLLFVNLYLFIYNSSSSSPDSREGWFQKSKKWIKLMRRGLMIDENQFKMIFSMIYFAISLFFTVFWYFCQIFFMVLYMLCCLVINVIYYILALHWHRGKEQKINENEQKTMVTSSKPWMWQWWMSRK